MDRDFDGKLSFEEFMGEETPLERLFRSMDKDGDGAVTKEVDLNVKLKSFNKKKENLKRIYHRQLKTFYGHLHFYLSCK